MLNPGKFPDGVGCPLNDSGHKFGSGQGSMTPRTKVLCTYERSQRVNVSKISLMRQIMSYIYATNDTLPNAYIFEEYMSAGYYVYVITNRESRHGIKKAFKS
jgi:hypothetical protein